MGDNLLTEAIVSLPSTCPSLMCNVVTFHSRTRVSTPLVTNPYGDISHTICGDKYSNVSTQFCTVNEQLSSPSIVCPEMRIIYFGTTKQSKDTFDIDNFITLWSGRLSLTSIGAVCPRSSPSRFGMIG